MINTNFITKQAVKTAKQKNFRQEYWLGIIITGIVRFVTALVSVYAGYYYFENLLSPINTESKVIPTILAVVLLMIIEFFTAWLLSKVTKSTLEKRYQRTFILLIFAVFTFAASFYSGTNGLAMRQSGKADNTSEIVNNSDLEIKNITAKYDVVISELKEQITSEKQNPQGWRGNKRTFLTAIQLERITKINNSIQEQRNLQQTEISQIKENQNTQLSENRNVMTETADKYWKFIAIIMLLSAVSNVAIQIFYMKILHEETEELAISGQLAMNSQNIKAIHDVNIQNTITQRTNDYERMLIVQNSGMVHKPIETQPITERKNSKLGFNKFFDDSEGETTEHEPRKGTTPFEVFREPTFTVKETKVNTGTCEYCGKSYTKRTTWQKYCSEDCKGEAFEIRTGRKFYLKKKK